MKNICVIIDGREREKFPVSSFNSTFLTLGICLDSCCFLFFILIKLLIYIAICLNSLDLSIQAPTVGEWLGGPILSQGRVSRDPVKRPFLLSCDSQISLSDCIGFTEQETGQLLGQDTGLEFVLKS